MGQGEVGGNGSVLWKFVHHDDAGKAKDLAHLAGAGEPGDDQVRVGPPAGPGILPHRATGKDPIPFGEIGARHGVPGHFRLALQYPTPEAAAAAKAAATVLGNSLVLFVRAIDRSGAGNLNANLPKEIRIDW